MRTGFTTTSAGIGDFFGFELDGDGRFLLGDFTVTHNTTVLRCLCASYGPARVALCAPTGRAAKRVVETTGREASTIHRLLGYGPEGFSDAPVDADVVVCDETSMVDSELLASLLVALPPRARLVLVGDPDQLPPVGPGAPFRDLVASGLVPVARLTEIRRQAAGSRIVQSAHSVRRGGPLVETPKGVGDRSPGGLYVYEAPLDAEAAATIVRAVKESIPRTFGVKSSDVQVIVPTRKGACGVAALNAALQEALNPVKPYETFGQTRQTKSGEKVFRKGDRVMQLKNDRLRGVVNGDLGYVEEASDDGLVVRLEDAAVGGQRLVEYNRVHLRDLDLAYACTVHKLQGSQAKVVVVGITRSHWPLLTRTVLYTAITRAQELCVVVGDPSAIRRAIGNVQANGRRTLLPSMLEKLTEKFTEKVAPDAR